MRFFLKCDGGKNGDIYVMNADGSNQKNLANTPAHEIHASWSPDGNKVAFRSTPYIEKGKDYSAKIEIDLRYVSPTRNRTVLVEKRILWVSPPKSDGSYTIDWDMTFRANADVELGSIPISNPKTGRSLGGFAGLSTRFSRNLREIIVQSTTNSGNEGNGQTNRFRAKAIDFTGKIGSERIGMAIIDHLDNPNVPSPWYTINNPTTPLCYLNAAVVQYTPIKIKAGDNLRLRYRVWCHLDSWSKQRLEDEWERYAKGE